MTRRVRGPLDGPLLPYGPGFEAALTGQGYSADSIGRHLRLMVHLSRWLAEQHLAAGDLTAGCARRFLRFRQAQGHRHPASMADEPRHPPGVRQLGIADPDFLLAATHTHAGPVLPERLDPFISYDLSDAEIAMVRAHSDIVVTKIVQLVRHTIAATPEPVTLGYGVGTTNVAYNREGLRYTDPAVPTLVATSTSTGKVVATMFGYACHPVARGRDNLYDADYPGIVLRRRGYAAGWDTDPTVASASGSMLYYGWPCRLRGAPDGVEQRVINTVTSMVNAT